MQSGEILISDYKVLLINTSVTSQFSEGLTFQEHLGLGYLAGVLKEKVEVEIIDCMIQNITMKGLLQIVREKKPDFIGLTATNKSINNAIQFSREFKGNTRMHMCLGGHHATFAAEEILKTSFYDTIVYGEGEQTIIELIEALKKNSELDNIKGIYFKRNNNIYRGKSRKNIVNLDTLPFPDRSIPEYCLENNILLILNIVSSRGCPYNCNFCDIAKFYRIGGKPWRARSSKNFVDELEILAKKYSAFTIQFSDDNFIGYNSDKTRVYEIANEIINRGIKISFDIRCRADSFKKVEDDDLIKLLKQAGMKSILLGIDGGCKSTLKLYNKGITIDKNIKMINYLKSHNIVLQMGYIMFNPFLNLAELKEQLDFFIKTGQTQYFQMTNRLEIYPGVDIIQKLKNEGLLVDYSHDKIFSYNYKDQKVKIIADSLSDVQPEMIEFDGLIQHLELLKPEMENLRLKAKDIKEKIDNIYRNKDLMVQNYFDFFKKTIELVEKSWDNDKFNRLKERTLRNLRKINTSTLELVLKIKTYFNENIESS
ncbi:MAG: B12-binding domain-containing radical SAM protein [Promethearchaeota archaeon]